MLCFQDLGFSAQGQGLLLVTGMKRLVLLTLLIMISVLIVQILSNIFHCGLSSLL